MINVRIKQFDTSLPLPSYKSKGAACVDLYCRADTRIAPKAFGYVPLNIALEIPEDCWTLIAARSSTHKMGLIPAHGIGIGDWDYRGDDDEYMFPFYNAGEREVIVEKGMRIAQLMVLRREKLSLTPVETLNHPNRGAFGTTGKK